MITNVSLFRCPECRVHNTRNSLLKFIFRIHRLFFVCTIAARAQERLASQKINDSSRRFMHQRATRNHRSQPRPCQHENTTVPSIFPSHPQNDITPHHCRSNTLSHRPPIARRFYLTSSASFGIAARALAAAPGPVLAISVDDARSQWAAACKATDRLLSDWDTLSWGGGDAVRRELGTVGTSGPLFQLNKAVLCCRRRPQTRSSGARIRRSCCSHLGARIAWRIVAILGGSGKQSEVSKDAMLAKAKAEREVRAMRDAERKMGAVL